MFAISVTIYEILAKQLNAKKFDLESEGQSRGGENGTFAVRLEMFDSVSVIFFRILTTRQRKNT